MIELCGKAVADAHKAVLSERLAELQAKGIVLSLGILLVGDGNHRCVDAGHFRGSLLYRCIYYIPCFFAISLI